MRTTGRSFGGYALEDGPGGTLIRRFFEPPSEAGKAAVKVCQAQPVWLPDKCSGPRILGDDES